MKSDVEIEHLAWSADGEASVEIRPDVGMLALLSSMNYKPWYALSEFVDNALASYLASSTRLEEAHGLTAVTVEIRLDRAAGVIEIVDDAAGIAARDVPRAFRPASPPPDRTGLAQFGIGMKSAACWFANCFTVTTTAIDEATRHRVAFDVPAIVRDSIHALPVGETSARPQDHGTTVRLEHLHRPVPTKKTLAKVRKYLASIYRTYLRSGDLILIVGGTKLEAPEATVLEARRWDAPTNGPLETWRKEIAVSLRSGREVTGWLALRAQGSTSESGLALIYRGKVVVGAGAGAGEVDDLYRPAQLFGAATSFAHQRLIGELDVSQLRVTHSKDAIIWDGDEDELLDALRQEADDEPLPLLRMARLHRSTERGPDIAQRIDEAISATVEAASRHVQLPPVDVARDPTASDDATAPARERSAKSIRVGLLSDIGEVELAVVLRDGAIWLRIIEDDSRFVIELDREHAFMQAFAHLPNQQIEPILRLAAALGLAELESRAAGIPEPSAIRARLNKILTGPLARTSIGAPA